MELLNITEQLFPEQLSVLAHHCASLPTFPYFLTATYLLTAILLRSDPVSLQFAYDHPIASCVMNYVLTHSGGIIANIMVARPPLESVGNGWTLVVGTLCWYLVLFSPFDMFYKLCTFTPILLVIHTGNEFARAKKVLSGVTMAATLYPTWSLCAIALVGMFKASGKAWSITWYHLVYKPELARRHELLGISFITKASFVLALVFAYNHTRALPLIDPSHLLFIGAVCLTVMRFRMLLKPGADPFNHAQQLTWLMLTQLAPPPPRRQTEDSPTPRQHNQDDRSTKSKNKRLKDD